MTDREKVIKGLECAIGIRGIKNCDDCPYDNDFNCLGCDIVMHDALKLLKEQEAIKPIAFVDKDTGETRYVCSNCGYEVRYEELAVSGIVEIKHSYCPSCGKKVKWDA